MLVSCEALFNKPNLTVLLQLLKLGCSIPQHQKSPVFEVCHTQPKESSRHGVISWAIGVLLTTLSKQSLNRCLVLYGTYSVCKGILSYGIH